MAAFGWSASDIVAAIKITSRVCGAFKDAGGAVSKYNQAVDFLTGFRTTLNHIQRFTESCSEDIYSRDIQDQLKKIANPWKSFEGFLTAYEKSLGEQSTRSRLKKVRRTIQWTLQDLSGEVEKLKVAVVQPLQVINSLLSLQLLDTISKLPENTLISSQIGHLIDLKCHADIPAKLEEQIQVLGQIHSQHSTTQDQQFQEIQGLRLSIRSIEKKLSDAIINQNDTARHPKGVEKPLDEPVSTIALEKSTNIKIGAESLDPHQSDLVTRNLIDELHTTITNMRSALEGEIAQLNEKLDASTKMQHNNSHGEATQKPHITPSVITLATPFLTDLALNICVGTLVGKIVSDQVLARDNDTWTSSPKGESPRILPPGPAWGVLGVSPKGEGLQTFRPTFSDFPHSRWCDEFNAVEGDKFMPSQWKTDPLSISLQSTEGYSQQATSPGEFAQLHATSGALTKPTNESRSGTSPYLPQHPRRVSAKKRKGIFADGHPEDRESRPSSGEDEHQPHGGGAMHSAPYKIQSRRDPQDRRLTPPLRSKLASNAPRQNRSEPNDHTSRNRGRASRLGSRERGGGSRPPELEEFGDEFSSMPISWPKYEFASESRHDLPTYSASMLNRDGSFRTSSPAIIEQMPRIQAPWDDYASNYRCASSDSSLETDFLHDLCEIPRRDVGAPSERKKSGGLQEEVSMSGGKGRDPQALPSLEKGKNDHRDRFTQNAT